MRTGHYTCTSSHHCRKRRTSKRLISQRKIRRYAAIDYSLTKGEFDDSISFMVIIVVVDGNYLRRRHARHAIS